MSNPLTDAAYFDNPDLDTNRPGSVLFHGSVKHFARVAAVLEGNDPANPTHAGAKVVTAVMIAEARRRSRETCRCEDLGLRPGLTYAQLGPLEGGCRSPAYVCPTLDRIRRMLRAS